MPVALTVGALRFHSWCISGILNCSLIWEPNSKQHTGNYENCGKAFDSMKDHCRHEKIRNYLCNTEGCKYSSIRKDALKGHMDVHGEKSENVEMLERRARRRNCHWGRAKSNLIVPKIFGLRIRILPFRNWVSSFEELFYCNGLWTSRTCFPNFVKIVEIRSVVSTSFPSPSRLVSQNLRLCIVLIGVANGTGPIGQFDASKNPSTAFTLHLCPNTTPNLTLNRSNRSVTSRYSKCTQPGYCGQTFPCSKSNPGVSQSSHA